MGPVEVQRDGQPVPLPSRKASALLAYLAVAGQPQPRDALTTLLWPEAEPARARASLRQAVFALRQAGLAEWLEPEGEQLALKAGNWLDVAEFRQNVSRAAGTGMPPRRPARTAWVAEPGSCPVPGRLPGRAGRGRQRRVRRLAAGAG
jgi:DNA-binding SARP family transcriptional activator